MILRAATDADMGFICETFLRSIREASTHVEGVPSLLVMKLPTNLIANGWAATVAETDGFLLGWCIAREANELAWVFVRDMSRGQGVARYLLQWANVDTKRPILSPFVPNRGHSRFKIIHRPFEVLPR